jgi:hypothetical protein
MFKFPDYRSRQLEPTRRTSRTSVDENRVIGEWPVSQQRVRQVSAIPTYQELNLKLPERDSITL